MGIIGSIIKIGPSLAEIDTTGDGSTGLVDMSDVAGVGTASIKSARMPALNLAQSPTYYCGYARSGSGHTVYSSLSIITTVGVIDKLIMDVVVTILPD